MSEAADGIGDIITGGIFARTVDRMRGGSESGHDAHDGAGGTCLNCGAVRVGSFCHECGQGAHVHRTIASLGHDILHGVFHFEGKIWTTLPMLALHPGQLTRRYVHGERTKFVSPMALFLFSVFLLFAAVERVTMPDVAGAAQGMAKASEQIGDEADKAGDKLSDLQEKRTDKLSDDPKADVANLDKQIADTQHEVAVLKNISTRLPEAKPGADAKGGGFLTTGNDGTPITTSIPALDHQIRAINQNRALYLYKLKSASYKFSWALIPISVPFIWLLFFWRRDVGLYDHAIFAFHSLSFMTLLVVGLIGLYLVGVRPAPLWIAFLIVPPIHIYNQLKGAYLIGRAGAAWRTIALLLMTSITSTLFFLLLLWMEAE